MRRPSWDDYFIEMARLVAARSTCPRRQVGAVLVRDNRLVATGYNGSVRGAPHCDEAGCLLVRQGERESCVRTVHAELNALLQCAVTGVSSQGATLISTDFPCVHCAKAIVQAGVRRVVYLSEYPDPNSAAVFAEGGVEVLRAVPRAEGGYRLVRGAPSEESGTSETPG
ncbi:MAG: cytidine/deoxycytidylate deaminase family protein [Clostridia bacterium]|nr:cytidine/deoxycytidylate deaminase family protein [Clostridia bacterium]